MGENFLEILTKSKDSDCFDEHMRRFVNELIELHPYYFLWSKYLLRSSVYRDAVTWINNACETDKTLLEQKIIEFPDEGPGWLELSELFRVFKMIYKDSSMEISCLFSYAIKNGFPFREEIIFTYMLLGDVFRTDYHENFYTKGFALSRIGSLLALAFDRKSSRIVNLENDVDCITSCSREMFEDKYGREPSIEDVPTMLRLYFEDNNELCISVDVRGLNEKDLIKQFKKVVAAHKAKRPHNEYDKTFMYQFQYPTSKGNIEELQRYLDVYDKKVEGKTIREIAKAVYNREFDDDAKRIVLRDFDKAKRIISNAEIGFFPGQY